MATKTKAKKKTAVAKITWSPKLVPVADVNPTPNNYKIRTKLGLERLQKSLALFGLAGTTVVNIGAKPGKYDLIDGNSRREEAIRNKDTKMWVSVPSRRLTQKEYEEMAAMYDYARAGEVDIDRIKGDLGKTKDFFEKWGMTTPMSLLENLGDKADVRDIQFPNKKKGKQAKEKESSVSNIVMVQLFLSAEQEAKFRKQEEKLGKRYGTKSTTDTVYKAFMSIK